MSLGLPDYLRLGAGVVTLLRQKTAYDTANQDAIASLRTSDQEIELIGLNRIRQQEAINSQVAAEAIKSMLLSMTYKGLLVPLLVIWLHRWDLPHYPQVLMML